MEIAHPRVHAKTHPDKPALILADTGQSISYAVLVERADRAAALFARLGLREGDTIAIFLENHLHYPELCWAAKNSGITYACVSNQSSVDDAAYVVDNCDAKLLISSNALADTAVQVAQRSRGDLQCLMLDGVHARFKSYDSLLAVEKAVPTMSRRRGPSMLYSSGTTGRPKGVRVPLSDDPPEVPPPRLAMLRHHFRFAFDSVLIHPGPFYHAAPGRHMMSLQRLGGTYIGFQQFDAEQVLATIQKYRATHAVFVPTMMIRMLKLPAEVRACYDISSLRCLVHLAAPCPIPVKEQIIEWFGPIVEELYGGTEAIGHTFINSAEWLAHKGSVGRSTAGCQIRIVDESGNEVSPLQTGLIYMRNGRTFEYHKDPAKTRGAFMEGGWGTYGDVGHVDNEGYLYLTDRQSHMIISGGVNVYPQEAENVLYMHPAIADVAVIGVPHEEFGEEVKAVVQPKDPVTNAEQLEADIIAWCRARLSPIKCPRSVDFVTELPRNEAGKLVKRLVKERYWQGRASRLV